MSFYEIFTNFTINRLKFESAYFTKWISSIALISKFYVWNQSYRNKRKVQAFQKVWIRNTETSVKHVVSFAITQSQVSAFIWILDIYKYQFVRTIYFHQDSDLYRTTGICYSIIEHASELHINCVSVTNRSTIISFLS